MVRSPLNATVMTVAIMQPSYLGWVGYYAMLDQADTFILDDTAHVSLKSWQMRNRIRARDGNIVWLSIPTKARRGMPINRVELVNTAWRSKHWRTIETAYSHTPGWSEVRAAIEFPYRIVTPYLADFTSHLIRNTADTLGITTPIIRASTLGPTRPGMADRITDLCHAANADVLLNTPTAKAYLNEAMLDGITIEWFDYNHPVYPQGNKEWQPYLSILDCLAHTGDNALAVIRPI